MFRILPETYFWPIVAHVAENGQIVEKTLFEAEFKRHALDKIATIEALPPVDQVKAIVVGWRGCKDVDGNDVPFSDQALLDFITEFPEIMTLFFQAFHESWSLVKRKN
jgi:hypothetical protein